MKLSDYVTRFIADAGVRHVFMLPGGGAMHLNDSLRRTEGLQGVCNLHEQASAVAAEAYCRVTGNLGVAMLTTGPAGTNAVTGVACAWLDSTPVLFVSGQAKRSDLIGDSGLRQLGVQEIDIVSIVDSITKYAVTVMEPDDIRFHLEKALHLARTGRPGPVWIDVPLDVQAAEIDPDALRGFDAPAPDPEPAGVSMAVARALALLQKAERPVILAGNGVRVADAIGEFERVAERLGVPILTTCPGLDLVPDDHPLLVGRPGAIAPRGANFALQNSDFLLTIGARLDMAFVGYSHRDFARHAAKVIVDVDPAEIAKLDMDIAVKAAFDAKAFLTEMESQIGCLPPRDRTDWNARCQGWKARYPVVTDEHRAQEGSVSTYAFTEALSAAMPEGGTAIVGSSGAAIEIVFLCLRIKKGQRVFHNRGTGSMGLALPQGIGACLANDGAPTVVVEGDGSFQLNVQELQTIVTNDLPLKIFVLNNGGFASIRLSQNRHFGGLIAADASSGMALPDVRRVAEAYGIPTRLIEDHTDLEARIAEVLATPGPVLCEVVLAAEETRAPAIASRQREDGTMASTALEDLWPFLPRDEFRENMIVGVREEGMTALAESLLDASPADVAARLGGLYDAEAGPLADRIVLYGAGKLGRESLAGLRRHGVEPLAFVDSDPAHWGGVVDGLTVVSPAEALRCWAESATFVVAVSAGTALRAELVAAGCRAVVSYTHLYWRYPDTFLPLHGVCRPDSTLANAGKLRATMELWADTASREAYRAQIAWRLSLDYAVLPPPTPAEHTYFLPEIALWSDETFVDVGAYDGDTLREFFSRVPEGRAVALEPDPRNWDALMRNARAHGDRVVLHPVAAASSSGTLAFRADGTPGAALAEGGETVVRAARLDDLLADEAPTFLKLDVEGAELDALRGAVATIRRHRPVLAVCLYHKPEDLWTIPLFVASLGLDYRLLFRAHAEECWETVLYAVPAYRHRP